MLQPDAAARVKGGKDRREIVRKCAFIQSLQLSLPRTSPSQPRAGERGRLGCARLGTGTNSSLPCSGRFSGPVRDSPKGCKGARATSELVSRDKGANPARRGPSLRGKGVARVSPPGPACGGASPPGERSEPKMPGGGSGRGRFSGPELDGALGGSCFPPGTFSGLAEQSQLGRERGPGGGRSDRERPSPAWASYCQGMEEMCPALPFLLPGDGGDVPWSCALHCPAGAPGAPELRQSRPQPQDSQHSPWQPGWSSSGPALPSATRWICLASRARLPNAHLRGGNRPRALRWARTKGSPGLLSRGLLWTGPLRCLTLDTPQRQPRRTQRIQPALGSVEPVDSWNRWGRAEVP
ncbi:collagen alpha-1(III) chain-like [Manacus candei]|uniref:collagen alpha-1(III) chain-like n=1 Tax=Manacus candei TaxID=415023 RepID=UPI002227EF35|nr:collagen alpha-1(III) chain-like [Manacus candei]